MRDARKQMSGLTKEQAKATQAELAEIFTRMGLTQPPGRMCVGIRKDGSGFCIVTGLQDSDDL
ncbi:hypothetical protein [Streptomyces griseoaurantiacus]|uniref:hypothetical protein n=1 Tax=Streptomyces griseoaurantiacus TaxID=68213 RepID=UPI003692A4DA